jgi:hypothetical protein
MASNTSIPPRRGLSDPAMFVRDERDVRLAQLERARDGLTRTQAERTDRAR